MTNIYSRKFQWFVISSGVVVAATFIASQTAYVGIFANWLWDIKLETWIQVVSTATGIVGACLNARGIVYAFYIWIPSNLFLIYPNIEQHQYGTAFLYILYTYTCVDGIRSRQKKLCAKH